MPHNLVIRKNDEYVWMGMMPGMMGTVMPDVENLMSGMNEVSSMQHTFSPNSFLPFNESVHIVEQLGNNVICSCIDLRFEIV